MMYKVQCIYLSFEFNVSSFKSEILNLGSYISFSKIKPNLEIVTKLRPGWNGMLELSQKESLGLAWEATSDSRKRRHENYQFPKL